MRLASILAILVLTATPAFACPQCAMKTTAGLGSWFIMAGMILFPFLVVAVGLYLARRLAMVATEQENLSVGETLK